MAPRERVVFRKVTIPILPPVLEGTILTFEATEGAYFIDAFMLSPVLLRLVYMDDQHAKSATRRIIFLRDSSRTYEELGGLISKVDTGPAQDPPSPSGADVFYVFAIEPQKANDFD